MPLQQTKRAVFPAEKERQFLPRGTRACLLLAWAGVIVLGAVGVFQLAVLYVLFGLYLCIWMWVRAPKDNNRLNQGFIFLWTAWFGVLLLPVGIVHKLGVHPPWYARQAFVLFGLFWLWVSSKLMVTVYVRHLRKLPEHPQDPVGRRAIEAPILYPIVYPFFWMPFGITAAAVAAVVVALRAL